MNAEQLGQAWAAGARWPDDDQAVAARRAVEAELKVRDSDTFNDYMGLRGCGYTPIPAMGMALDLREARMETEMATLAGGQRATTGMPEADLWRAWSAAQARSNPTAGDVGTAAETELRRRGSPGIAVLEQIRGEHHPKLMDADQVAAAGAASGFKVHPATFTAPAWTQVAAGQVRPYDPPAPTIRPTTTGAGTSVGVSPALVNTTTKARVRG